MVVVFLHGKTAMNCGQRNNVEKQKAVTQMAHGLTRKTPPKRLAKIPVA
jgi:hypothetical protein